MIVDAHCHVWRRWPYPPPVPDPEQRASADHLIWHMNQNGVDHAVVIAASIGDNPDNAADAFAAADRYRGRLTVFPDLECRWSPHFRRTGAAARLADARSRWDMKGFTTYLAEDEDGSWLVSDEGMAFFALAERSGLIASLSLMPHQLAACAVLASRHPGLPVLIHHHAFFGPRSATTAAHRGLLEPLSKCANVFVKLSGLGNVAAAEDDYPYPGLSWLPNLVCGLFPGRVIWGSDFPVSSRHMTFRQTRDVLVRHGPLDGPELAHAMGITMAQLIGLADGP